MMLVERQPLGPMCVGSGSTIEEPIEVTSLDGVAGEIMCGVCEGTGVFVEPDETKWECTDCKGTGRQLVSI